jgi:hypothetical protein
MCALHQPSPIGAGVSYARNAALSVRRIDPKRPQAWKPGGSLSRHDPTRNRPQFGARKAALAPDTRKRPGSARIRSLLIRKRSQGRVLDRPLRSRRSGASRRGGDTLACSPPWRITQWSSGPTLTRWSRSQPRGRSELRPAGSREMSPGAIRSECATRRCPDLPPYSSSRTSCSTSSATAGAGSRRRLVRCHARNAAACVCGKSPRASPGCDRMRLPIGIR